MPEIVEDSQVEQQQLIAKFVAGDLRTFEMVFRDYYEPLVRYGNTFLKDSDESEDIVQQVFVSVWEKREELEVHTSIRALLYKAVHNACLNRIKHHKVRAVHAVEVKATHSDIDASNQLEAAELDGKIHQAIDRLPEQCAKIFKMSRFEQLKYQEIADQLGLSIKTIENQMGKALKMIRESLKDYLFLLVLFFIQEL